MVFKRNYNISIYLKPSNGKWGLVNEPQQGLLESKQGPHNFMLDKEHLNNLASSSHNLLCELSST